MLLLQRPTGFPTVTVPINYPGYDVPELSVRERNSRYINVVTAFFDILKGVDVKTLPHRVRLAHKWDGDDTVTVRHLLHDENGNRTGWSDPFTVRSTCALFTVHDECRQTVVNLHARSGHGTRGLIAQVGDDFVSLLGNALFWRHDSDGFPQRSADLLLPEQRSLCALLLELTMHYVEGQPDRNS